MKALGPQNGHISIRDFQRMPWDVHQAVSAPDDARTAASVVTEHLLRHADAVDEDGPLCHGWALHAAFLAGVRWREGQR